MFSDRQRKIMKWIGYPSFAVVCFLFFFISTLPYDKLQDKLISYAHDNMEMEIEIEELGGAFPLGMTAKNVTLSASGNKPQAGLPMEIPYLKIKAGLLSALTGSTSLDLYAEVFDGEIEGSLDMDSEATNFDIKLEAKDLNLEKLSYFKNSFGELPVKGKISSDINLLWNTKQVKESAGTIDINVRDGVIGPGKWQVQLPMIRTGDLQAKFVIADGKLKVDNYTHQSPDMESDIQGDLTLNRKFEMSRANMNYRFKISPELVKKNDVFKLGLSMIQNARANDDYYYFSLRGTMGFPCWQPNKGLSHSFKKAGDKKASKPNKKKISKDKKKKKPSLKKPRRKPSKTDKNKKKDSKKTKRKPRKKKARKDAKTLRDMMQKRNEAAPEEDEPSEPEEDELEEEEDSTEEDSAVEEDEPEEELQDENTEDSVSQDEENEDEESTSDDKTEEEEE